MLNTNERPPLLEWAQRLRNSCPSSDPQGFRKALEATLLPMIRCALRNGTGQPPLVRWVQRQLPLPEQEAGARADPSRHAGPLARLLCERLMARLDPLPGRETVVGP
jgi:hypothetical protein